MLKPNPDLTEVDTAWRAIRTQVRLDDGDEFWQVTLYYINKGVLPIKEL